MIRVHVHQSSLLCRYCVPTVVAFITRYHSCIPFYLFTFACHLHSYVTNLALRLQETNTYLLTYLLTCYLSNGISTAHSQTCDPVEFQVISHVQRRQIHLPANGAVSWRRTVGTSAKQVSKFVLTNSLFSSQQCWFTAK